MDYFFARNTQTGETTILRTDTYQISEESVGMSVDAEVVSDNGLENEWAILHVITDPSLLNWLEAGRANDEAYGGDMSSLLFLRRFTALTLEVVDSTRPKPAETEKTETSVATEHDEDRVTIN
jgi:hypothetical protein